LRCSSLFLEDVVKKYGKDVSDCENIHILVDDKKAPLVCHLYFGWDINSDTRTVFTYKGLDAKIVNKEFKPGAYDREQYKITLEELRELQQGELWNDAMKGHELEDLYNL